MAAHAPLKLPLRGLPPRGVNGLARPLAVGQRLGNVGWNPAPSPGPGVTAIASARESM